MTPSVSRRAPWLAALFVLMVVSAGCLEVGDLGTTRTLTMDDEAGASGNNTTADEGTADESGTGTTPDGDGDTTDDNTTTGGDDGNTSTENETAAGDNNTTQPSQDPVDWPALEDALVRPGVQHVTDRSQCTINFVYRSPVNGTLYLGTAAHCVDDAAIGDLSTVRASNGQTAFEAPIVFNAWDSIGFVPGDSDVGDDIHHFDFALLEVPEEHEDKVHPAVLHFGGPTRLATEDDLRTLQKVIGSGASGLRPARGPADWHEGYITGRSNEDWTIHLYTITPGIPGDSGSGIMTDDGAAIGAASAMALTPIPGENIFSSIPKALEYLEANDWPLELQTWEIINGPLVPL